MSSRFARGHSWTGVQKERTYGTLQRDICNTGKKRYEWKDQKTLL